VGQREQQPSGKADNWEGEAERYGMECLYNCGSSIELLPSFGLFHSQAHCVHDFLAVVSLIQCVIDILAIRPVSRPGKSFDLDTTPTAN
jgi:hypothetical protein